MTIDDAEIMLAHDIATVGVDLVDDYDPADTWALVESGLVWDTVVCEKTAHLTPSLAMEGDER